VVTVLTDVELRELRAFLAVAEELHFGRAAERLGISQPSVSEAIRLLERRIGTRLFERTSRRVTLTPDGAELRLKLAPIVESLDRTLSVAHDSANPISGSLRIGTTFTTFLPPVYALGTTFLVKHPRCQLKYSTVDIVDPLTSLRRGQIDVLVNWLAVNEPDLTASPAIAYFDRMVAVGHGHRLAGRESVSVEELADETVGQPPPTFPASITDAFLPPRTPSGRPIHRRVIAGNGPPDGSFLPNVISAVARGEIVHITVRGLTAFGIGALALVPISDLPALPLGLIWRTAGEDAKIRALAEVARCEGSRPSTSS
jgi:DNA-binding transcriptional LysR family regulator